MEVREGDGLQSVTEVELIGPADGLGMGDKGPDMHQSLNPRVLT